MLQEKVLKTIEENDLIQKNDKIIIGVSGGPDSMCLLNVLNNLKEKLQIELLVCHINHGIRKEADEETLYVQEYCKNHNIPCYVKKENVKKLAEEQKIGTEEMGRKIRYEFFEEIAIKEKANKIATAHTVNDNVETVLMNLLRGTAISGLKGIEIKRDVLLNTQNESLKQIKYVSKNITKTKDKQKAKLKIAYIRPLRECTRAEIEEYCKEQNLNPKIDKSNLENIYTRNKIRNELIPYIQKEFNPNIINSLNRLSDLAKQNEQYFEEIVKQKYETLKLGEYENEIILNLKEFNLLPKVIKTRLLLYSINKVVGTTNGIAKIHLEDIIKLCQNNIGNKFLTPHKNIKVFVKKGKIFLNRQGVPSVRKP